MSAGAQAAHRPGGWLRAGFEAAGLAVWAVGIALALLGVLVFVGQEWWLGRLHLWGEDAAAGVKQRLIWELMQTMLGYADRSPWPKQEA